MRRERRERRKRGRRGGREKEKEEVGEEVPLLAEALQHCVTI